MSSSRTAQPQPAVFAVKALLQSFKIRRATVPEFFPGAAGVENELKARPKGSRYITDINALDSGSMRGLVKSQT
jgi:hypothetical protein